MKLLKKFYRIWLKFGALLGTINGFIILTVFYSVIIGLYALPVKLLKLKKKPVATNSFWKPKDRKEASLETVRYQF